ncbi:flagellar hook-associated protein FlgK [Hellea sp.]|nr:flagellar hook-associated protein FlgK [Hellea sp.]
MSLSRALSNAYTGLATSGFRANVAASNVANASTPGYVRREVITTENVAGNRANGVRVAGVERHQDFSLTRLRRDSDASFGRANILASAYDQLNSELGAPGDEYGLFASFESLESNFRELASTPESPALQNAVLASSTELVNQFNDLATMTNSLRNNADANIGRSVETVNTALERLHTLNGDIASMNPLSGDGAAALEDERQKLIDSIAEIIPINDIRKDGGQVDIVTDNGVYLLSGEVHELSFQPAGVIPPGASYADGTGNLSGLFVGDQELTPGTGGNFSLSSGTLAGYFSVRDNVAPTFSAQLDSLAADLVSRFSNDGLDPTKAAGAPGIFTDAGGPVDVTNISGIAGRLRLNAAIDPVQGGSATRFRDGLGATTTGPTGNADIINGFLDALNASNSAPSDLGLSGSFSSIELVAGFSSVIGENSIRHNALSASALTRSNALYDAEIQKSGVDTDQEMQSLLLIEQSYAANARVIQTVGEMIDRLMQI